MRAAVAAGCNGLFFETHPNPDQALSDGPNMIPLDWVPDLLQTALTLRKATLADPLFQNSAQGQAHKSLQNA